MTQPSVPSSAHDAEMRLVGWGTPRHLPFMLIQAMRPVDVVIDGQLPDATDGTCCGAPIVSPDYLRQCDPTRTEIVILAQDKHHPAILERIRSYGDFRILDPDAVFAVPQQCGDIYALPTLTPLEWEARLRAFLHAARQSGAYDPVPGRVALWLHGLAKGGAERQMVLLALGLRQLGREVDLLTLNDDVVEAHTWSEELQAAGVNRFVLADSTAARKTLWPMLYPGSHALALTRDLAPLISAASLFRIFATYSLFMERRPENVISYLDDGNIMASLAAVMAGVPAIHMSGRNAEPNQFDSLQHFCIPKPLLRPTYRCLLDLHGVTLANNSTAGVMSYAAWLDVPTARIPVVANAVARPGQVEEVVRTVYSIAPAAPLLVGVMRLSEEKQPEVFVRVFARVLAELPEARAILVGDGPLHGAVQEMIAKYELVGRLILAGTRDNALDYMRAADLLLLTSRMEGMPNVILEAQSLGCPVVATDVGGVREALAPMLQDLLCVAEDVAGLAANCCALLADKGRASALGMAAREYTLAHHDSMTLARSTLGASSGNYESMPLNERPWHESGELKPSLRDNSNA